MLKRGWNEVVLVRAENIAQLKEPGKRCPPRGQLAQLQPQTAASHHRKEQHCSFNCHQVWRLRPWRWCSVPAIG